MSNAPVVTLSRFRSNVSRAMARRGKRLLEAADLPAQVTALEPLEAYFIVKELGVDESVPILLAASDAQIQAFVDLDCWDGDRPSPREIDAWLAPFAAAGRAALAKAFVSLEPEIQTVFLMRSLHIYDARTEEELPPERPGVTRTTTEDGFFVVEPCADRDREIDPLALLSALTRERGVEEVFRLLAAAKWELLSATEEEAYRFRSGRLQDLGFAAPDQALRIFAAPQSDAILAPEPRVGSGTPDATTIPALYAATLSEETLIYRALAGVTDADAIAGLSGALIHLINTAVIAYGQSPKDLQHVAEVARRVRDTLCIGLEVLISTRAPDLAMDSEQATEQATMLVLAYPLLEVFRHGHAAALDLQQHCRAFASDPVVASWYHRAESERSDDLREQLDRAFVDALLSRQPLRGGYDPSKPSHVRAFASLHELSDARQRLDELAKRFFDDQSS